MPTAVDLVTDLPADFEVSGQAVATSLADLLGGTTGQILAKNSATDMDFVWIANDQGDITGITATTPLTGGGTSGAITVGIQDALTSQKGAVQLSDSTSTTSSILAATPTAVKSAYDLANTANTTANAAIAKAIVDAKGDLIAATAADTVARLAIGTNAQVLTADSAEATGMKWATPAAGGGWTLLANGNLTTTTVTASIDPTGYKQLVIFEKDVVCTTDWYIQIRLNGTLSSGWFYINSYNTSTTAVTTDNQNNGGSMVNLQPFEATNTDCMGVWIVNDPANTNTAKIVTGVVGGVNAPNTFRTQGILTGQYADSTSAITSVRFDANSTFSSGTYEIYGVK
jgi:hypothetical protein